MSSRLKAVGILLCFAPAGGLAEDTVERAEKEYAAQVERAKAEYEAKERPLREDYEAQLSKARERLSSKLEEEMKSATRKADLDSAVRIRELLRKLNESAEEPVPEAPRLASHLGKTGKPTDLLKLLKSMDLEKNATRGNWRFEGNSLVSPRVKGAHLEIPWKGRFLPPRYAMSLLVERKENNDTLGLAVLFHKKPVFIEIDGWHSRCSGIYGVEGKEADSNETTLHGCQIPVGETRRIDCKVTETGIAVFNDGKKIIDWKGEPSRISGQRHDHQIRQSTAFAVYASESVFHIKEFSLAEIGE